MDLPSASGWEPTTVPPSAAEFGVELARLRILRGWSVRGLAERTAISEGQICNLQSGRRNPTAAMAAVCDAALGAGGVLEALADKARDRARAKTDVDAEALIAGYTKILNGLRDLGRAMGPRAVAAPLSSIASLLADAAPRADHARRREVWLAAARYAEYVGWMAQEMERPAEALRWTDQAVRWAALGGDETMAAYSLVRRAFIAQHRGDRHAVVAFALRASNHPAATTRIRAHAARREAQGHAALGDQDSCQQALERAQIHRAEGTGDTTASQWGPRIENGSPNIIEASCLVDLGRFSQAADIFAVELQRAPAATADVNSRTRFTVRHATAQAGIGDMDGACNSIVEAMVTIERVDSATVRAELRRFLGEAGSKSRTGRHHEVLDAVTTVAYRGA